MVFGRISKNMHMLQLLSFYLDLVGEQQGLIRSIPRHIFLTQMYMNNRIDNMHSGRGIAVKLSWTYFQMTVLQPLIKAD